MKRKLLALALALVICVSLCGNVFAGSDSDGGKISGPGGTLVVTARLTVDQNTALATTQIEAVSGITVSTTVVYYYLNANAQTEATSYNGTTTARVGNLRSSGIRATSQHMVRGGSNWGSWSCSLAANAKSY